MMGKLYEIQISISIMFYKPQPYLVISSIFMTAFDLQSQSSATATQIIQSLQPKIFIA
jgi:hypothetical protein